jgi:lipoyl-dependent peroxiredoxin
MATKEKVLFTGRTHTTGGRDWAASSGDKFIDIKLPQPHPAAENLFAIAWSARFIGAIEVAAGQRKIKLVAAGIGRVEGGAE